MAVYDLEEQEQISQIKAWWEQYGKFVTALALTAALASVSWQGMRWYQNKQAAEAGVLYYAVQQAVEGGDAARAREAAGQIIERHAKSAYAEMAALMSASAQFAAGDNRNARAHLEWLRANTKDPVLRDLARLRLATVMLADGSPGDALAQLDGEPAASLKARFEDLRGDILAIEARPVEAAAAYRAALEALSVGGSEGADALMEVIRIKLESLET
jgi:predicted negative regulator of RcsB-dependent stress response